ncbi:delta-1-pyrroline-5-carboxylate synthase-like isoform X2 [Varroa destructor]|uniref:Delta-1-pyrroline-5-carboxylate synthase n=1 Tax=Varroa destructor TaxID=109461 RepID=A0A7M7KRG7_VARDE|nr:delta-1-pyrroline-5-carboxylate synthase-like isoform X1 [Varroa destructor]XP_022669736.1 delta-1-pyrroline-5-carboxylate synthase-like isoform X1 [Varroa destructor]XP_022669737.1 delta-1-pyrroline-5-carboxylate synthase-like isoform X2 [Varroa destructor]
MLRYVGETRARVQSGIAIAGRFKGVELYRWAIRKIQSGKGLASKRGKLNRELQLINTSARQPYLYRSDLVNSKRVVVKLGSAVLTREDGCGLALGRVASIVEQISQLHNNGKELLVVTSGAVAFGKLKLSKELRLSMSMRETLSARDSAIPAKTKKSSYGTSAAVGQSGLMALYDAMFNQYGVNIAQVLVTKPDFYNPESRHWLRQILLELLSLNILPIINTNDAVSSATALYDEGELNPHVQPITDNDSLAAHLAVEADADLMVIMSNVDGLYTQPPGQDGSKLLYTYSPLYSESVVYGEKSKVGMGGMESKISAALWALERGVSVVICNGFQEDAISRIVGGKKVGTFFTNHQTKVFSVESLAANAKKDSGTLEALSGRQRGAVIRRLADLLVERADEVICANVKDIREAESSGLEKSLLSRLVLTLSKLENLADGLRSIAIQCEEKGILGKTLRRTLLADGLELQQITVPIGVLLVIFESRPDCLPQIASLAIATGNGLLLKGGKEALNSNRALFVLVQEALASISAQGAVALVSEREDVDELLHMEQYIDLIIPRGSSDLVRSIQARAKGIPVLGHSEGVCHVYVDKDADLRQAYQIVRDSKCDYPAACNSMETLLIHRDLINSEFFSNMCTILKKDNVLLNAGPRLSHTLTFGPPEVRSLKVEYSRLECALEVVDSVEAAIDHINAFGSGHTDAIVTENHETAEKFLSSVDSACVFRNASTRFADGYRFGLGAEVGISTGRIHARGPVGLDGLLTTKWQLRGSGDIVSDFHEGDRKFKHESLPLTETNDFTCNVSKATTSQE